MRIRYCTPVGLFRLLTTLFVLCLSIPTIGQTFEDSYPDYPSLSGSELIATDDGYDFVLKESGEANYRLLGLNTAGSVSNVGALVDLPENSFNAINANSIRLSDGHYIVAHIDDSNFSQIPPTVFLNQYDGQGNLEHSFEVDLPENAASISVAEFAELADGTVFLMIGHAEESPTLGPPVNSHVVTALYNPTNQLLSQQNTYPWSNLNWNIRIERLEAAPDGTVFAHINQVDVVEGHFVVKLTTAGQELWRNQVSSLARPVIDMVPTEDGGVWAWNNFFSTLTKYAAADGSIQATINYNSSFWTGIFVRGIAPAPNNGIAVIASNGDTNGNYLVSGIFDQNGNLLMENAYDNIESLSFFSAGFAMPDGSYAFAGRRVDNNLGEIVPALVKLNAQGQVTPEDPILEGFDATFYQSYSEYGEGALRVDKIEVNENGYDLELDGFTARFSTAQTDEFGNLTNQGPVLEIPNFLEGSPNFFTLQTSVKLSNGDILASHSRSPNNPDFGIHVIHYDSEGAVLNTFDFDLPANTDFVSGAEFEETEDGSVFMMASYTLENSDFTRNIISGKYTPVTQNFIQLNEFEWGDSSTSFAVRRIEAASDGNFFVHFYQSFLINAHYVSKVSSDGLELWRFQASTLERPVDDLVPTADGGVWVSIEFFNSIIRYDADGELVTSLSMNTVQSQVQGFFEVKGITLAPNNGLAMLAITNPNSITQLGTAVFDGDGSLIQVNTYPEYEPLEFAEGYSTPDGGFAFGGYTDEVVDGFLLRTPVFVKTNSFGEIIPQNNGGVDLSLSIAGTDETPGQWSNHSVTVTVTNEGGESANGIMVSIPQPAGDVYTGGNEFTANQGTYEPYGDQTWNVGSLDAGSSAIITINYFKTQDNTFLQYAEVSAMDETDSDSTPGNGNGMSANEDDEAIYPNDNLIDPCNPDVTPPVINNCPEDITIVAAMSPVNVSWVEPEATDNCSLPSLISSGINGGLFQEGTVMVNYNSNDDVGNNATTCTFSVTVIVEVDPCNPDLVGPVISNCPDDILITTAESPVSVVWEEPIATDNCVINSFATVSGEAPGDLFNEGTTTVIYSAWDGFGNQTSCVFDISIIVDDMPPSGTCEDNILNDPGFENGFADWQAIGNAQSTSDAFSGSAAMFANDPGEVRIIQGGSAIAGETYTLSAYSKISDLNEVGVIYIKYLTASFQPIESFNEDVVSLDYQPWSVTAIAPANTAYYEVGFRKYPGDFEFFADEFCFQEGEGTEPPVEEMGCYFEEIYESVPSSVSFRFLSGSKENADGSFSLRFSDQLGDFSISLRDVEVSANGGFESTNSLGGFPNPNFIPLTDTEEGFLTAVGSSGNIATAELYPFGTNVPIWENDYMIPEASSVAIDDAGVTSEGFVLTGRITQGSASDVYYPILIRLDATGNLIDYQIDEVLSFYTLVKFVDEGTDGYFLKLFSPVSVSTSVVKTDELGNWLWSRAFPNGQSSSLTRVSEASDGSVYVSILGGVPTVQFAPISVAEFYRLDSSGNQLWTAVFGMPSASVEKPAMEAVDGGAVLSYILREDDESTFHYKKFDQNNTLLWEKTYGDINADIRLQTQDGGLLFAGTDEVGLGQGSFQSRPYLLKTTSEGNLMPLCEGAPPNDDPDLILENLNAPYSVQIGETINYTFTLSNIGQGIAVGDFNIKAFFSTDNVLSADDIFDGLVPTGNIAAGQTITNVLGASVVPDLPSAGYYLILKVDADDDIVESTETNNTISVPIFIEEIDLQGCDATDPVASDFPWHEWLSKVTLGLQVEWPSDKSPYSDFTEEAPIPDFIRGAQNSFIFDITYSYFTYTNYIRYYVDFNQNGIFEENEFGTVTQAQIPPGNGVTATRPATLAIPVDAILGETRVRIIMSREPIMDACSDIDFGEIEDYTVRIVDNGPSFSLTNINELQEVQVYPNPVNDELTVEITNDLPAEAIEIYDARGLIKQRIEVDQREDLSDAKKVIINTSDLINGIYLIQVKGDFKPRTQRVMVQRTY